MLVRKGRKKEAILQKRRNVKEATGRESSNNVPQASWRGVGERSLNF